MNNSVTAVSAGGSMIMTNSSMSGTIGNMAGGTLVVSSGLNKPLTNTTTLMTPGQPHLGPGHSIQQVRKNLAIIDPAGL